MSIPQNLVVVVTSNEEKQFLDEMVVERRTVTLGAEITRNKDEHTNAISGSVAFRCQIHLPSNIKVTSIVLHLIRNRRLFKIVEEMYKDYVQQQSSSNASSTQHQKMKQINQ